jgi:hypothetical protein
MEARREIGDGAEEWLPADLLEPSPPTDPPARSYEDWGVELPTTTRERLAFESARSAPEDASAVPSGPHSLDLNSASYGQLQSMGLSPTQSARLVAARDRLGGFRSMADVDELPGFPSAVREVLHERCRVGTPTP